MNRKKKRIALENGRKKRTNVDCICAYMWMNVVPVMTAATMRRFAFAASRKTLAGFTSGYYAEYFRCGAYSDLWRTAVSRRPSSRTSP